MSLQAGPGGRGDSYPQPREEREKDEVPEWPQPGTAQHGARPGQVQGD